jgi:hypothetical protein
MSPADMGVLANMADTPVPDKLSAVMQKPREMIAGMASPDTDPNGSYTGKPVNKNEKPVQDADDL